MKMFNFKNIPMIKVVFGAVLLASSAIAAPAIWDGTADVSWYESSAQAYNLTTAEQLAGLAKLVNQGSSSFEGKTITLGADIFLNDTAGAAAGTWASIPHTEWTPIGTSSRPFKGEFDGIAGKKNRKIYGLYVSDTTKNYVGLFGYTNNVKVSNLDVLVGRITAKDNVGALVGYAVGGSLTNVHSEVKVTGNNHVGGLVGYFTGNLSASSVKENVVGQDSVGGLVGYLSGSVAGSSKDSSFFIGDVNGGKFVGGAVGLGSSISKTYVKGNVQGNSSYVGGLAGYATGTITTSYHEEGDVSGAGYVGGLAGYTAGAVTGSHSEGDVTGTGNYVGGLVGSGAAISTSYHKGGDVSGAGYVGGLAGYTTGAVTGSHSEGNVTGTMNYVGGLIGLSYYYYSGSSALTIVVADKSYSIGNVKGEKYVGGLIGLDSIYRSSYNTYSLNRQIKRSNAQGSVEGAQYIGGVLGKSNYGYRSSSYSSNFYSTIDSVSHTSGIVSGSSYVGGLVGYTYGTVTGSHSEGDVTGTDNYVGGLVGLSYYAGSSTATITTVDNSYSIGNVKGVNCVGGLVGLDSIYRNSSNNNRLERQIKRSYAKGNVEGLQYTGGVLGKTNKGYFSSSYISNIYSTIDSVSHTNGTVLGTTHVGGLVGYTYGKVTGSHAIGIVRGTNFVGGLAGYAYETIDSSYHEGGDVSGAGCVGGLAGIGSVASSYHIGGDVLGTGDNVGGLTCNGSVSDSYSEGNITGRDYVGGVAGSSLKIRNSYAKASYVKGRNRVGGLSGYVTDSIIASYYEGDSVTGVAYVGGLAGYAKGSVTGSHSEGHVTGTGNYVGGLLGLLWYTRTTGTTFNALDTVRLKDSYAIGDVRGAYNVGGIVGKDSLHKSLAKSSTNSSTKILYRLISNVYSKGSVEGKLYVGGLIGAQNRTCDTAKYVTDTYIYTTIDSSYHDDGVVKGDSNYIGGLIGSTYGFVNHSHSNGDVLGFAYVGGLIGNGIKVNASHAIGAVNGGSNYVGGLTGSGSVSNSYSEGNVSGLDYVGGLTGRGSVSNSYSEGNVSGLDYVGGAAGLSSKILNSYTKAAFVRGRNLVGGLVGSVSDSIKGSYFEGDSVTGIYQIGGLAGYAKSAVDSSYSTANVKGDDNVGGLIGSAYGNVSNSYALGNVDGDVDNSSAGNDNLGGLVGYQYSGSVTKSMSQGNITGTTKLGGLVGRFDGTSISQSYANGNVTGDYYGDPADEVGNYYIGGLVGYAKGTLTETYASGVVKGIEDEPVYTGCVVGYVKGSLSVSKSYYDKTKCGLGVDGGEETATVSGSPDKTTAEMQTQETFEDWDFVDTWKILEGTYPFLQIYSNSLTNAVVTTASLEGIEYDGTAKTPLVTSVTLFGELLEYETEYTITYKDNINAGMASINICGVQPYGGCKVVEFEIAGIAIEPSIAAIENVTYTGRAQTPEIKVYNGATLLAATDYEVEYKDNVNAGTATVTVTMKGNYSGSASRTFTIEKATPVISRNPSAGDVVLGETLAASELVGGSANVDGEFVWKTPTTKPALENDGYAVVFVPTDADNYTNSAEIIVPVNVLDLVYVVVHADETALDSVTMVRGSSYTLPNVPNRVGYDFVGLYKGTTVVGNPGEQISITENTVIEAVYKIQSFVITFKNGSTVLQSSAVDYGTIPVAPTVTLPENTAQYTYSFVGWDKDVVAVTEAAVYTAVIDTVVNKYEVVFKDYNGTELKDTVYDYGTAAANIIRPLNPTRASTAQYTYAFVGWNPAVTDVTEDVVYTATYDSVVNTYRIAFVNAYDSTQSVEMEIEYGKTPVYEGTPTRSAMAQYAYTFSGWSPEVETVTGNATYTALFDSTLQSYVVSFVNGSEELQSGKMAYGTLPEYTGTVPTKKATAQYTYTFKGWNPAIASVTGTVTYEAVFDSVVNKYLITFKNDSITLQSDSVAYGTIPEYPTVTLPKNTAQYTYSMSWDKEVVAVTEDAVYTMTIDSVVNNYNVVFTDFDGTILKETSYAYGTAAASIAKPADPAREATAKYIYSFKGWSPSILDVTKDVVYKAVFDSTIRVYVITFVNGSSKLQSSEIEYGTMPSYKGDAPTKESTKEYTYLFKGWSPTIASVTGTATYTAVFDSTVRKYTVTFKNDGSVMQTISVAYGTIPVYAGSTPTRAESDSCTYTFSGWNPKLESVTSDVTYSSVFEETMKNFLVRFMNGKNILEMKMVAYGEMPEYTKNTPTKASSKTYSYEFVGWSPEIGRVTKATDFVAVFDSVKTTGIADARFANLEMSVVAASRSIQISAAPVGASYAIFDMQGRVLKQGRVDSANFNIAMPIAGNYLVKVGNRTQRVSIK